MCKYVTRRDPFLFAFYHQKWALQGHGLEEGCNLLYFTSLGILCRLNCFLYDRAGLEKIQIGF